MARLGSLLFALLKHTGATPGDVVRTRALVSFAWVAGPPLATALIAAFGSRAILAAIAVVAVLNIGTTAAMRAPRALEADATPHSKTVLNGRIVAVVVIFIALQATNSATVSIMSLFVTDRMGLDVAWSGVALGVAAGLEIPALLLIGKLSTRVPGTRLFLSAAWPESPTTRPWPAGIYANTRRLGAVVSGPLIGAGSTTALGYGGVFLACAIITVAAFAGLRLVPSEHPEEVRGLLD